MTKQSHKAARKPAAAVSIPTLNSTQKEVRRILELGSKGPVTLTLDLSLPIFEWQNLQDVAEENGVSLEGAIALAIMDSDFVYESSNRIQEEIRKAGEVDCDRIQIHSSDAGKKESSPLRQMLKRHELQEIVAAPDVDVVGNKWRALACSADGKRLFDLKSGSPKPMAVSLRQSVRVYCDIWDGFEEFAWGDGFEQWLVRIETELGRRPAPTAIAAGKESRP